ncbi:MAG: hypothetical protein KDK70_08175 [Myxococcales bacterium]|nr:hypothetical protein [Myxococcales bacterium]
MNEARIIEGCRRKGLVLGLGLGLSLSLAAGCSDEGSGGESTSGPGIDLSAGSTRGSDGQGDDLDVLDGSESSEGLDATFRCNNVDFVFVVDNSPSMLDEQQFLVQGVPGFISAMQNAIPNLESFRVGVIDTDSYPGLGTLEAPLDGCDPEAVDDCEACDYTLGAFLTKPQSAIDPEITCDFSTGQSYMDGTSETFANEFGCAAVVGAVGNPIEQQAGALVAAVSSDLLEPGACNEGFVRDDALLVFLVISDEEDNHASPPEPGGSLGEPKEWYEAIVAAKGGHDANVVGLGLLGGSPKFDDCADLSQGVDGAEQSSRLVDFVERFPTHFVGSVCSDGYGGFFQEALDRVATGCANFIP